MLALIWMVQDDASPATQYLIDYLLLEFPPLVKYFDEQHRHSLVHGEEVMRARLHDDRVGLLDCSFGKRSGDNCSKRPLRLSARPKSSYLFRQWRLAKGLTADIEGFGDEFKQVSSRSSGAGRFAPWAS